MGDHHNNTAAADTTAPAHSATSAAAAHAFIQRWQRNTASELATAQSFVIDLCQLLGVDKPHPTPEQIDAHRKRVLAPEAGNTGLTLTGLYNVLAALREGRALTAKEKTQHT